VIGLLEIIQVFGLGVGLVFVLLLFWGLRPRREGFSALRPHVSVLVAARAEEANIGACLESLAGQDYPADRCEFILVDDASADGTGQIIQSWCDRDERFRMLRLNETEQRTQGPKKRALAAAYAVSRGEIIMVTDADCTAGPSWIGQMVRRFDYGTDAVCGLIRFRRNPSFWWRLAAFESAVNSILNAAVIGLGGALSCSGANFAYRREAFLRAGGFDAGGGSFSGDDDLLLQRMKAQGSKVRLCDSADAMIETEAPLNRRSYWRRKRRHLSAGSRYSAQWLLLAGIIYAGCLSSVALSVLATIGFTPSQSYVWIWGLFSLALLSFFLFGVWRLKLSRFRLWAFCGAFAFPLIFTLLQPLTLLPAPVWKGRSREA
jgi:cellulose synthase/poly-beta-1,6-N-acetylglucosamine synthase-like glycosyltransferase